MATQLKHADNAARCAEEISSRISAWKFVNESVIVNELLEQAPYSSEEATRIEARAADMVVRAREDAANRPLLDTFLTRYGLSNKEGIALMCLAESLLRIPDSRTAERLIADKIKFGDWASHAGQSGSLLVNMSTWALLLGSKLVEVDSEFNANPGQWLGQLNARLSQPVIEKAMRSAMRIPGAGVRAGTIYRKGIDAQRGRRALFLRHAGRSRQGGEDRRTVLPVVFARHKRHWRSAKHRRQRGAVYLHQAVCAAPPL